MSQFCEVETEYNDAESIIEALKELGYEPKVYSKPVSLHGYRGDKRKQTAEIVVPRKQMGSASNDLGFKRQADGKYKLIISEFDISQKRFDEKRMKQEYAAKRIYKTARTHGFRVVRERREKNKIHITLRR
jgi:hypothetical protein